MNDCMKLESTWINHKIVLYLDNQVVKETDRLVVQTILRMQQGSWSSYDELNLVVREFMNAHGLIPATNSSGFYMDPHKVDVIFANESQRFSVHVKDPVSGVGYGKS